MSVDLAKLRALVDTARAKSQPATRPDGAGPWYRITNQANRAEISIYGEIGGWGVSADEFIAELRAITAPAIDLHIASPGGAVTDGFAIYEAIRQHPAHITSHVEGVAASAASFIAQGAAYRKIGQSGMLLVHDAEGSVINGTAADMAEMSAIMDEISAAVAEIYAERSGTATAAQWRERMRSGGMNLGTRYFGQAAVDVGLADEVAGSQQITNMAAVDTAAPTSAPELDFDGLRNALKGVFFQ